mgnify:CR=1 FL=1
MNMVDKRCSCCGGENPEKVQIDAILARYQGKKGSLIPILQEVQALYNYLEHPLLKFMVLLLFIPSFTLIRAGVILSAFVRELPAMYVVVK